MIWPAQSLLAADQKPDTISWGFLVIGLFGGRAMLRDNPPAPAKFRSETRPCFMQMPKYNMCHDDMPQVLERLRVITNGYDDIFTVAEPHGLHHMADADLAR